MLFKQKKFRKYGNHSKVKPSIPENIEYKIQKLIYPENINTVIAKYKNSKFWKLKQDNYIYIYIYVMLS